MRKEARKNRPKISLAFLEFVAGYILNQFFGIEIPWLIMAGGFSILGYWTWTADADEGGWVDRHLRRYQSIFYGIVVIGVVLFIGIGIALESSFSTITGDFQFETIIPLPLANAEHAEELSQIKTALIKRGQEIHLQVVNPYPFPVVASTTGLIGDDLNEPIYIKWQGKNLRHDLVPPRASNAAHIAALGVPRDLSLGILGDYGWRTCINILLSNGQTVNGLNYLSRACSEGEELLIRLQLSVWTFTDSSRVFTCSLDVQMKRIQRSIQAEIVEQQCAK